ncbi:MAG: hypothetical protein ACKOJI_05575, partial [Phycisphaerales bacterium]
MLAAALAMLCLLQDATPRQVWVFIDRWKEFGGTVVEEREAEFTVEGPYGERRSFTRNQVLDVVDLVRPEPGQRGIVQLRDGTIVRGEILKDALDEVEFRVDSFKGTLPREKVYRVLLGQDRRADAPVAGLEVELEHHAVDLLARQRALDAVDPELHLVECVLEDLAADDGAVAQLHDAALPG